MVNAGEESATQTASSRGSKFIKECEPESSQTRESWRHPDGSKNSTPGSDKWGKWLHLRNCPQGKPMSDCWQLKKFPLFILVISLVETAVYYAADDGVKSILMYDRKNKKDLWRFLTYMLLHADELHLGLNVVIQGLLGVALEVEQGGLRCAAVYFGGGLAGSLGTSAFSALSLMAGASAGIYALLTSQIPNVVLNYGTIKYAGHRIFTVSTLTAADIIYVSLRTYFYDNQRPEIGWVAHASGAAAGILLGFLTLRGSSEWKRRFRVTSAVILVLPSLLTIALSLTS